MELEVMEALILVSAALALARLFTKSPAEAKTEPSNEGGGGGGSSPPPPPPPPRPPVTIPQGVPDRERLDQAARLARRVAENVKARQKAYDRSLVSEFQREAGLTIDGVYGPRTAGAVKWYTGESVEPLSGRGFTTYVPAFGAPGRERVATAPMTNAPKREGAGLPQTQSASKREDGGRAPSPTTPIAPPRQGGVAPAQRPGPVDGGSRPGTAKPSTVPAGGMVAPAKTALVAPTEPTRSGTQPPREPAPKADAPVSRLDRAAELAKRVVETVKSKGQGYDRAVVVAFQREAGLTADGLYGPKTAGAVKWYTNEAVPPISGGSFSPYAPSFATAPETNATSAPKPSSGPEDARPKVEPPAQSGPAQGTPAVTADRSRLDRAAELAKRVLETVKGKRQAYDRAIVSAFQREAGLVVDGVYGPKTAGAVKWYTNEAVPPISGGGFSPYAPDFVAGPATTAPIPSSTAPNGGSASASSPIASSSPVASAAVQDPARLDRAAALAKRVAENLKMPAAEYNRALMSEFQREAGLTADGIYGPRAAGAVKWYTNESITPKTGRRFVPYVPKF
jgi:peptidoglycan hydrolase-like protein with peptidoglycan-binding domain